MNEKKFWHDWNLTNHILYKKKSVKWKEIKQYVAAVGLHNSQKGNKCEWEKNYNQSFMYHLQLKRKNIESVKAQAKLSNLPNVYCILSVA